jgi:hypothetical protein
MGQKVCVVPLEPPDGNGRAVDFDHLKRRKRIRLGVRNALPRWRCPNKTKVSSFFSKRGSPHPLYYQGL